MNEPSSWITRLSHQTITIPRSWKQDFKPALYFGINHGLGNYFRIVNVMIFRVMAWFMHQTAASRTPSQGPWCISDFRTNLREFRFLKPTATRKAVKQEYVEILKEEFCTKNYISWQISMERQLLKNYEL